MRFSFTTISLALLALSSASPVPNPKTSTKTAAADVAKAASTQAATAKAAKGATAATAATAGSVLTSAAYNDFQISSGTAGKAEAEANALFADIDTSNLAAVSASDLKIIQATHDVAEDAEVEAFNPAVDAATGDAATALQNGKIKNKVLKLTATVLALQVKGAQGGDDSKLAAEQTKLAKNIQLDVAAAGEPSTAVPFTGST
ncbi:Uncharacterized protein BP5553_00433 [Venustampulla echinocandica]|uniref:Small secreted protein n=1 Tax=Venustampulla echinocandica TaxID=2656787 RepID=A0A370TY47_9HELO|nr:Uncharacterized protein BP5553_00433 [Venustampulla echinocandica]RDL40454.1 Uncharacterized protein BP5553_00433 [Venustampulla echinocandica]